MPLIADRMALVSYGSSDEGSDLGSDREEEEEKSTPQQPVTKKSLSPEQPPPQNSNNVSSPPKVPYKLLRNCIIQLFEFQLFKMYVHIYEIKSQALNLQLSRLIGFTLIHFAGWGQG